MPQVLKYVCVYLFTLKIRYYNIPLGRYRRGSTAATPPGFGPYVGGPKLDGTW
jgi:hypothetical protein